MTTLSPEEQRKEVGGKFTAMFSGASTSAGALKLAAEDLTATPGAGSFLTPLPWELRLANGEIVRGRSANLVTAAHEIAGHLGICSPDDSVALSIDTIRLRAEATKRTVNAR